MLASADCALTRWRLQARRPSGRRLDQPKRATTSSERFWKCRREWPSAITERRMGRRGVEHHVVVHLRYNAIDSILWKPAGGNDGRSRCQIGAERKIEEKARHGHHDRG